MKTGFLVGATPRSQQLSLIVGALASAAVVGWTLLFLNDSAINLLPVNYPSYTAPASQVEEAWTSRHQTEDGKSYRVLRLPVEADAGDGRNKIPAGKYLVGDDGALHYLVNPGVGGIGEGLTASTLSRPDIAGRTFSPGANVKSAGQARGMDDQIYEKVVVSGLGTADRRFLVDPAGAPKYELIDVTKLQAPKAALMGILVDGVLTHRLPWTLIYIGVFIAILLEVLGVQALPVAVGIYLPISTSATIFVGGLVRAAVTYFGKDRKEKSLTEEETGKGVLLGSGLIAGGAIGGLAVAFARVGIEGIRNAPGKGEELLGIGAASSLSSGPLADVVALLVFGCLVAFFFIVARQRSEMMKQ